MILRPKNWSDFQHYKNRNPPWIRFHKRILDDRIYQKLPIASRALAPMLWLLASESKDPNTGEFDGSVEELTFRLRWPETEIVDALKPLIDSGFFEMVQIASTVLAECLRDATPEKRREETETETENICASSTDEAPPTRNPPIPYQVIADAFNLNMERLPKVRELNAKRKTLIRTAWQENAERRTPEFWTAYFEECASDSFLNGSGPYKNGHENWRPSFDYLLKGDVVTRVFEKALDRMEREG